MSAKKPTPAQMRNTVHSMLELDLIACEEMRELAQWMLEEYRTSVAKSLVAQWNREKKAEGKTQYPASAVKTVRGHVDISFDEDGLIDAHARSVGLILTGADA